MGNANSRKPQREQLPFLQKKQQLPPPPPSQPEPDDHFTCEICGEHMLSENKFQNKFQKNPKEDFLLCVHPFCIRCTKDYVQFRIEKDRDTNIKCPGLNCDQFLDPVFCRNQSLITPTQFDKWCDLLCERTLSELDRCYCPNPRCSAMVVNECGDVVKRIVCPNCKTLFCFQCKLPWHAGFRCKQQRDWNVVSLFLNWDQNDVAYTDLAKSYHWRRCPQCRNCVELKIIRCSIAKCRCGFCFICERKEHQCDCCRYCGTKEHQCHCCRSCGTRCHNCGSEACFCCRYCPRRRSVTAAVKL